jgi:hypothetical protein
MADRPRRRRVPQRFAEENYDHNQQLVPDLQPQSVHEAAVRRGVTWHELIADPRLRNPQLAFQVLTDSNYIRFVREWHVEPCWVFGGRVLNRPPFTVAALDDFWQQLTEAELPQYCVVERVFPPSQCRCEACQFDPRVLSTAMSTIYGKHYIGRFCEGRFTMVITWLRHMWSLLQMVRQPGEIDLDAMWMQLEDAVADIDAARAAARNYYRRRGQ